MRALPDCAERALRGFGPFAHLATDTLAGLAAEARVQRLPRGARLWRTGRPASEVFLLGRGLVSIHQAGAWQGKVVVDFGGPGDVLGAASDAIAFAHGATATVVSDQAHVIALGADTLADAMRRDPALARALAWRAAKDSSGLERKLRAVSAGAASARLATALLELAARYGRGGAGSSIVLPFSPPATELAAFAGVPRLLAVSLFERWTARELIYLYDEALVLEEPAALAALAKGGRDDGAEAPRSRSVVVPSGRLAAAPVSAPARPATLLAVAR